MLSFIHQKKDQLKEHMIDNINGQSRKNKNMFFKEMSDTIGTKKASQCKSRYQKMEKTVLYDIGLSKELIKAYFVRKTKTRGSFDIRSTIDNAESMGLDNESYRKAKGRTTKDGIESWDDLRTELEIRILPFIKDKCILRRMEKFTNSLQKKLETGGQIWENEIFDNETSQHVDNQSLSSEAKEDCLFFEKDLG
jgi:hypothetical protein